MTDKLNDNDRQRIYKEVNRIFNESESVDLVHELMFKVGEYATLFERQRRKLWDDENNNLIKELGRRDGKIQQLEAERSEVRNKVIEEVKTELMSWFIFTDPKFSEINELLNSLKTK